MRLQQFPHLGPQLGCVKLVIVRRVDDKGALLRVPGIAAAVRCPHCWPMPDILEAVVPHVVRVAADVAGKGASIMCGPPSRRSAATAMRQTIGRNHAAVPTTGLGTLAHLGQLLFLPTEFAITHRH